MNGKYHSVHLYDPKAVGTRNEAKRFMLLWNAMMKSLKLQPKWQ